MTAPVTAVAAALHYPDQGWPVLPLQSITQGQCTCGDCDCRDAGKHPRTHHGVKDATTDAFTIRRWWERWPDANVAIATGAASGFFVLDVDTRHGGDDSLTHLESTHGSIPETPESITGSGGRHIFFGHPGGNVPNKVSIAPGLDVRGDAGYIVAPPSLHLSGRRYEWDLSRHPDDVRLAPAPNWLLALITVPGDRLRRDGTPLVIPDGARNATLIRFAGLLRRYGIGPEALEESLQALNRHHCQPPLPASEVQAIARSAARYPGGTSSEMSDGASRMTVKVG